MPEVPIHAAASLVLVRQTGAGPRVLMGQRGAGAAFMPSKFVFPGGRVDPEDAAESLGLSQECLDRLAACPLAEVPGPRSPGPAAIIAAARRELREETGLDLVPGAPLRFIFRAITPRGMARRFDARFLLADAADLAGAPDDFSAAEDELSHLQWVDLAQTRSLDLPFITEIVLAELRALLAGVPQSGVPFFDNAGPVPTFRRLI